METCERQPLIARIPPNLRPPGHIINDELLKVLCKVRISGGFLVQARNGWKDAERFLSYKPEHAVDLNVGVIVVADVHPAEGGRHEIHTRPFTAWNPAELVAADRGYQTREVLEDPVRGKIRFAKPTPKGCSLEKRTMSWIEEALSKKLTCQEARIAST